MNLSKTIYNQTVSLIGMKAVEIENVVALESGIIYTIYGTTRANNMTINYYSLIQHIESVSIVPYKLTKYGESVVIAIPFSKAKGDGFYVSNRYEDKNTEISLSVKSITLPSEGEFWWTDVLSYLNEWEYRSLWFIAAG